MSIAELTAPRLPRRSGGSLRRQVREVRGTVVKAMRRYRRRAQRVFMQWHRQQYYFWMAHRDMRRAVTQNEDIFLASILIFTVVLFALSSTVSQLILLLGLSLFAVTDQLGLSFIPLFMLFGGVGLLLVLWVLSWMTNMVSLALMDGANRKRLTSLRITLRRSLRLATRVSSAWLLYLAVVFSPVGIAAIAGAIYVLTTGGTNELAAMQATLVAGTAAATWLLYSLTSYGLVPMIALFETDKPLTSSLQRSRRLVTERGRPFIFALYAICAGGIVVARQMSYLLEGRFGAASMLVTVGASTGRFAGDAARLDHSLPQAQTRPRRYCRCPTVD